MIEGQEGVTWGDWVALADACEEHGVEALFRSDHYISGSDESRPVLDAWATLAGLAARTTKLELGTLVSPGTFRPPSLLARNAATADEISGGRIVLGLGAGWMQREHDAFGFDFATTRERVARFAEQLEIIHDLLHEDTVDFDGAHYGLHDAPGLRRPDLTILVGGSAKPGTTGPAVRFADEYNCVFGTFDDARERKRALDEACERRARGQAGPRRGLRARRPRPCNAPLLTDGAARRRSRRPRGAGVRAAHRLAVRARSQDCPRALRKERPCRNGRTGRRAPARDREPRLRARHAAASRAPRSRHRRADRARARASRRVVRVRGPVDRLFPNLSGGRRVVVDWIVTIAFAVAIVLAV